MLALQGSVGNRHVQRLAPGSGATGLPGTVLAGPRVQRDPAATESAPPSEASQTASPAEPLYTLTLGSDVLQNVPKATALTAVRRYAQQLQGSVAGGQAGHDALKEVRDDQQIVGFFADVLGGVRMPSPAMWIVPRTYLDAVRANIQGGELETAVANLAKAERAYKQCYEAFETYRDGTISGAETGETVLEVTAAAGAVAATVATGGAAAAAGGGLLATSAAVGAGAGVYGATQTAAGQSGEMISGTRAGFDFDLGPILRRGATDAITGFVGALAGGALSKYAARAFGSYLGSVGDDVLLELGQQMGLKGPLPRDFLLTQGQRFVADFLGGVGTSPLTTSVGAVVNQITGGGALPSAERFAEMVVGDMVRGGILQIFLGAFLHAGGRPARGGDAGSSEAGGQSGTGAPTTSETPASTAAGETLPTPEGAGDPAPTRTVNEEAAPGQATPQETLTTSNPGSGGGGGGGPTGESAPMVLYRGTTYTWREGGSANLHDLGPGVYMTTELDLAVQYAQERRSAIQPQEPGSVGLVDRMDVPQSELGNVLDFYNDQGLRASWEGELKQWGGPTGEGIIQGKGSAQNYFHFLEGWLQGRGMSLDQFDVIIGPEYRNGGAQVCIRNPELAAQLRARATPFAWAHD